MVGADDNLVFKYHAGIICVRVYIVFSPVDIDCPSFPLSRDEINFSVPLKLFPIWSPAALYIFFPQGMDIIERIDVKGFRAYLKQYGNTICGRNPIAVLLSALETLRTTGSSRFGHGSVSCQLF